MEFKQRWDEIRIEGIREEREALKPVRKMADHILDTTDYTVHQLRDYIKAKYASLIQRMEEKKDLAAEDEKALHEAIKDWKKSGSF